jgi:hypothetical protein
MSGGKGGQRRRDRDPASGGIRPVSLTPMSLSNDPARSIKSSPVQSREATLRSLTDASAPAAPVQEHKYVFSALDEVRPELRPEPGREIALRPITISPTQMQDLRERRIAARDLGWVIPGHKIRIQP